MDPSIDQLVARLAGTARCRPEVETLAGEWAGLPARIYDSAAARLSELGEGKALGILLNVAAANRIKIEPHVLAGALKRLDDVSDFHFPCRYQDESVIGPLLEVALAEDLSWERQALAAHVAAELAVKFDQSRQPVKKVLWTLSRDVFAGNARMMIHVALSLLDPEKELPPKNLWLTEKDILAELPENRPPVVIGGDFTVRRPVPKLGRNEPCHCGSGHKYKKCCFDKDQELLRDASSYQGITRSQFQAAPSLVDDVAPIENMRLHELRKLIPATLNDAQLLVAYRRAEQGGLRELGFELLLELKHRPGKESLAVDHMGDLFDSALQAQDRVLAGKLARQIPEDRLYSNKVTRLEHALLENPGRFADLEAICKEALTGAESRDHLLLELSYAFAAPYPAMSVAFGRAAIVSEPDRHFDNEVLMETIEKSRILLDLEPWGDPIEEVLDWRNQEGNRSSADKDREIDKLKELLAEAREKSTLAIRDLRRKELDLAEMEKKLQSTRSTAPAPWNPAAASPKPPAVLAAPERNEQIIALRRKIETLKEEIRSQQKSRQHLRRQLQEASAGTAGRDHEEKEPLAPTSAEEESVSVSEFPRKIQIPEFAEAFRKSCDTVPRSIAAKAVQAAAGFAARDESVIRQAAAIDQLPGFFRVRIGIHYRLMVRQMGETLQVIDIIPRQKLETWIRQQVT